MSLASSYSQALLETLTPEQSENVLKDLQNLVAALDVSKEFRIVLFGAIFTPEEKQKLILSWSEKFSIQKETKNFFLLLNKKGRLSLLSSILTAFEKQKIESSGACLGHVHSAEILKAEDLSLLKETFSKKIGSPVAFKTKIDTTLIAGLKVTIDGKTYDGSVLCYLKKLKEFMFAEQQ